MQISNQVGALTVTQQTANNTFKVQDSGSPIVYSGVSSINITGTNAGDTINLDFGALNYTGSLLINSGNGNDSVSLFGASGKALGNVNVLPGYGDDTVNVDSTGAGALTFGGNLQITDTLGSQDKVNFGNASAVLSVNGNVSLTGMNFVRINADQAHSFLGDFSATLGADTSFMDFQQEAAPGVNPTVTFGKSLTITGGSQNDFVSLGQATIGTNLTINLKTAPGDAFPLNNGLDLSSNNGGTGLALTTVNGNFNYTGGAGADWLDLSGTTFLGNVTMSFGTGTDLFLLDNFTAPTSINGSLTVYADGDLDTAPLLFSSVGIQATIGGNASFYLGNGNNRIVFGTDANGSPSVGGKLIVRTGNGDNLVTVDAPGFWLLDVSLGSGEDSVTFGNSPTVSGIVNGGGGTNTFTQDGATLVNFTLMGF